MQLKASRALPVYHVSKAKIHQKKAQKHLKKIAAHQYNPNLEL